MRPQNVTRKNSCGHNAPRTSKVGLCKPSLAKELVAAVVLLLACNNILDIDSNYGLEPSGGGTGGRATAQAGAGRALDAGASGSAGADTQGGSSGSQTDGEAGQAGDTGQGPGGRFNSGTSGSSNAGQSDDGSQGGEKHGGGAPAVGAAGGEPGTSAIATVFEPCTNEGALACEGNAQKERLGCDGTQWLSITSCSGNDNCDTRPGNTAGSCEPIVLGCEDKNPGDLACRDLEVIRCGPDLVTSTEEDACSAETEICEDGACVRCVAGTANCDDNAADCETDLEAVGSCGTTCDDVVACANENGTAACSSAVCVMECALGFADCSGRNDGCETDLTSTATCGESCTDRIECDLLSGGICVNGGCSNSWAAWPMPNSPVGDPGTPNPASYTDEGNGTVTDNVTSLVWQKTTTADAYNWSVAAAYCASLSLAGETDWRVPSLIELVSLVDYGQSYPAINVTAFPGTTSDAHYWSSSPSVDSPGNAWLVHFAYGGTVLKDVTNMHEVRCVR
jgi:hypothetical protein